MCGLCGYWPRLCHFLCLLWLKKEKKSFRFKRSSPFRNELDNTGKGLHVLFWLFLSAWQSPVSMLCMQHDITFLLYNVQLIYFLQSSPSGSKTCKSKCFGIVSCVTGMVRIFSSKALCQTLCVSAFGSEIILWRQQGEKKMKKKKKETESQLTQNNRTATKINRKINCSDTEINYILKPSSEK